MQILQSIGVIMMSFKHKVRDYFVKPVIFVGSLMLASCSDETSEKTKIAAIIDYNRDGVEDAIFVSESRSGLSKFIVRDRVFEYQRELMAIKFDEYIGDSWNYKSVDLNNDGALDIVVSLVINDLKQYVNKDVALATVNKKTYHFLNDGKGNFEGFEGEFVPDSLESKTQ